MSSFATNGIYSFCELYREHFKDERRGLSAKEMDPVLPMKLSYTGITKNKAFEIEHVSEFINHFSGVFNEIFLQCVKNIAQQRKINFD